MRGDTDGRAIADLGCGTGILGIGAILLGASKVYFVDNDENALNICSNNLRKLGMEKKAEIALAHVGNFDKKVDVVFQNPPFGTKIRHADREFLEKAFEIAGVVYSFHKLETREFIERFAQQRGFVITNLLKFGMPLKVTQKFHKSRIRRINVGCWRFEKAL
jgi:putative methylase